MEIERKWMVPGWPSDLCAAAEFGMWQGYVSVHPTVRIRREAEKGGAVKHILCFKSGGGLCRQEIETEISPELFAEISQKIIAKPLIDKLRRNYPLPGGLTLEVNRVDEGAPTEFFYAEVEFATKEQALGWNPADCGLGGYLADEVTEQPGQSMGAYWLQTRGDPTGAGAVRD